MFKWKYQKLLVVGQKWWRSVEEVSKMTGFLWLRLNCSLFCQFFMLKTLDISCLLSFTANKQSYLVVLWICLWNDVPVLPSGYVTCSYCSFWLYQSLLCIVYSEGKHEISYLIVSFYCSYAIIKYFDHWLIVSLTLRSDFLSDRTNGRLSLSFGSHAQVFL